MLDHSQLFKIARHARLGRRHPRAFQMRSQRFLSSNPLRANQIKQFLLPLSFQHQVSDKLQFVVAISKPHTIGSRDKLKFAGPFIRRVDA